MARIAARQVSRVFFVPAGKNAGGLRCVYASKPSARENRNVRLPACRAAVTCLRSRPHTRPPRRANGNRMRRRTASANIRTAAAESSAVACPHSGTCSFRRPSALRKRRRPANRESLRAYVPEAFYGMDMLERSPLPLAAELSSARDRYGICVCRLPFISVFGNCIPFYTAAPPKLPPKAGFRFLSGRAASALRRVVRPVRGSCGG